MNIGETYSKKQMRKLGYKHKKQVCSIEVWKARGITVYIDDRIRQVLAVITTIAYDKKHGI